ncbi:hypothetical protein EVAR_19424_1 [Eumeta japonica]|uniref:Uncharacterized protein n=1 Tax=Eumeta variegata TaxID=151549 RepID=A0A4C1TRM1_EUMVA|nr:hypothetical protein EVAR_19424_1 [Eumeta japonica]
MHRLWRKRRSGRATPKGSSASVLGGNFLSQMKTPPINYNVAVMRRNCVRRDSYNTLLRLPIFAMTTNLDLWLGFLLIPA